METITDSELIDEIVKRLSSREKAIADLTVVSKKIEALNRRLLESEKLKSNFLSNIRNEINNPLTTVLTLSKMISSDKDMPRLDELMPIGRSIHKEAFILDFQLRNIFAAAEIEAGERALTISRTNVGLLISHTIDAFRHLAIDKSLTIIFDETLLRDAPFFTTDSENLYLIFSNLISNAIEYSYRDRTITIKAWRDGVKLHVSVQDEGVGIDEKDHQLIFDRFRQLDTGMSKSHAGHGLGLSITRALIEMLNGNVTVSSRKEAGAVFTVSIPEMDARRSLASSDDGNDFFFDTDEEGTQKF